MTNEILTLALALAKLSRPNQDQQCESLGVLLVFFSQENYEFITKIIVLHLDDVWGNDKLSKTKIYMIV